SPGPTGSTPAAAPAPGGTAPEPPVRAAAEPVPAPHARTRLRIAATGRCVEIPDAEPAYGVQAREAACDGSAGQQWDVLMPYEGDRGRLQVRNTATGLCLRNSGTTKDREPVVQHRCDAGDRRQLWWLYTEDGTVGSLWDQDVVMILGLADWYEGEKGLPHSPRLATNHNYYNSSSFRLLFDGVLFDGRMAEAAERPS
ncbi:RICIN domain-containing protein, partial [Streptomyces sp. CC53]|uniref:RICIN domain-containing protein n=1 Tax=Streptomyces sp. CC53 TaxID=1906740 RepID=UPI001C4346CD